MHGSTLSRNPSPSFSLYMSYTCFLYGGGRKKERGRNAGRTSETTAYVGQREGEKDGEKGMMKEREREREKRLSPLLFRLPESRTDEQSSGALKGQRPGPTGALRVSLFFSSLSLSLAALYNIACVYIYIPTFVGRRKICEKKGKAAHTNTEEKKKEREKEKKDRVPAKYIEYNELSALERIFLSLSKGVKGQWLGAAGNSTTTRKK